MGKLDSLLDKLTESTYSGGTASGNLGHDKTQSWRPDIRERFVNVLGTLGAALALIIAIILLQPY